MPTRRERLDFRRFPGHYVRRVHQLAVALFGQETSGVSLTPVQFSSLQTVADHPGIDQKTLALTIGYDTSTIAGVLDRLEQRGLVTRIVAPSDRRMRQVSVTSEGEKMLDVVVPGMLRSQDRLLEPLSPPEREEFMRMMRLIVDANAELANIPAKD